MVTVSDVNELQNLEQQLEPIAGKRSGGDFSTCVRYLETVRRLKLRRSELVARYGLELLRDSKSKAKLGDEVWSIFEQVAIATLDVGDLDESKKCIGRLMLQFPGSLRVAKLEGMWLEAKGWYSQAEKIYKKHLDENPSDTQLHKRRISILKAQGNFPEAIQSLTTYLKTFMSDWDAWRELALLYCSMQMYKQACFCFEELIISNPLNPIIHLNYAEILYTIGGIENLKIARKYYAMAVEQSYGNNVRALYGICLCTNAIVLSNRSRKEDKEGAELADLSAKAILKEYFEKCPNLKLLASSSLEKLGFK